MTEAIGLTFYEVAEALLAQTYVFAKTMPRFPHHYVVRKNWKHHISFDAVVQHIRDHGYPGRWGGQDYVYFHLNGLRYWTMGAPVDETIILNRAEIPQEPASYDAVADTYDEIYADDNYQRENDMVFNHVPVEVSSLLDIGCGTGLALDYIAPQRYVGIDPSQRMLSRLTGKFKLPPHGFDLLRTDLKHFHLPEQFDYVLCLFGVASYMTAEEVRRIPDYVKPGGNYMVMVEKPDYTQYTHETGLVSQALYRHDPDILPGNVIDTGNGYNLIVHGPGTVRKRTRAIT